MTDHYPRTAYTTGLRQLADLIDANPDLPLPDHGTRTRIWVLAVDVDTFVRMMDVYGSSDVSVSDSGKAQVDVELAGVRLRLMLITPSAERTGEWVLPAELTAHLSGLPV